MPEEIFGSAALRAKFERLPLVLQKTYLVNAAKAGSEPIRAEAERRAPRLNPETAHLGPNRVRWAGLLAKSEMIKVVTPDVNSVTVQIGPSKEAWYGGFIEFGTIHIQARPFLRPAFDEKLDEAQKVIRDVLWNGIESEAGK